MDDKLFVLDVGHGNSTILSCSNSTIVIDAGPGSSLLEFLKSKDIRKINAILISHADKDHIEGLIGLLSAEEFKIEKIRVNSDSIKKSAIWDDLLYALHNCQMAGEIEFGVALTVSEDRIFDLESFKIEILAPTTYLAAKGPGSKDRKDRTITSNSISSVIKISKNESPLLLFTGDIDLVGLRNLEEYLSASGKNATAPVLVYPHHGGKSEGSSIEEFTLGVCKIANPETIVFSIGRGKYKNPQPAVIEALRQHYPSTRILCTQLSEHCATEIPESTSEHLLTEFSAGKEKNTCCCGTISISISEDGISVLPCAETHNNFISSYAPSALCKKGVTKVL